VGAFGQFAGGQVSIAQDAILRCVPLKRGHLYVTKSVSCRPISARFTPL